MRPGAYDRRWRHGEHSDSGFGSPVAVLARLYRTSFGSVTVVGIDDDHHESGDSLKAHVNAWLPAFVLTDVSTVPRPASWLDAHAPHFAARFIVNEAASSVRSTNPATRATP